MSFLPSATWQGNIFTGVCPSVHKEGVCETPPWQTLPSSRQTPPGQTPAKADNPHPPRQTSPGRWLLLRMVRILMECLLVLLFFFRSLGQGNVFTPVCHSVHKEGGLCPRAVSQVPWFRFRDLPGLVTPQWQTSLNYSSFSQTHWQMATAADGTHPNGMHSCVHWYPCFGLLVTFLGFKAMSAQPYVMLCSEAYVRAIHSTRADIHLLRADTSRPLGADTSQADNPHPPGRHPPADGYCCGLRILMECILVLLFSFEVWGKVMFLHLCVILFTRGSLS